jgi:hypothetical protein
MGTLSSSELTDAMGLSIMGDVKLPDSIREFFQKQGKIGAAKRTEQLTPERRREIAKNAANARWKKSATKEKAAKQRGPGDKK